MKDKSTSEVKLTLKQRRFCDYYLEWGGNGVQAVIKAGYNVSRKGKINKRLAASIASENLTKPNILEYLDSKLEEAGFTDPMVKKHHLFLLQQFSDLRIKARAIDMYYKLAGMYKSQPEDMEGDGRLDAMLDRMSEALKRG